MNSHPVWIGRQGWTALAAVLLAPIAVRAALIVSQAVPVTAADGVGLLTDLAAALGMTALVAIVPPRVAALRLVLVVVWGLLQYAHYEHVTELGAGLQFTFAHYILEPTFLFGSFFAIDAPALAAFVSIVPAVVMLRIFRADFGARSVVVWVATAAVLLVTVRLLPSDPSVSKWRQRHFLVDLFDSVLDSSITERPLETSGEFAEFAADLSGAPIIALPGIATNVILLVLEGLPASVLESISATASGNPEYLMKRFSEISERGLVASNFVMHQRQTNRGVYSLLCGDYPKLDHSMAKMTEYLDDSTRPCLPRVLGARGYRTVYLQGAPLSFMYKDQFTRSAGFQEIFGNRAFDRPIHRTAWGVDDKTLLRRAGKEAERLAAAGEPFFLTVLTVGTHHPAVLPPRFVRRVSKDGFEAAAAYLDEALGELVEQLQASGILDDTLLIITADESRGNIQSADLADLLTRNWGPFVVLTPESFAGTIVEPYGQSDVALSILDYLGIDPRAAPFIGRSVFRKYSSGRRVFFGNTAWRQTGAVDAAGSIHVCDTRGEQCKQFASSPSTLFVPTSEPQEVSAEGTARIKAAIRYSRRKTADSPAAFALPLAFDRDVVLIPGSEQILMDGQFLHVPANARLDVEIECAVEGSRGVVSLSHTFADGYAERLFSRDAPDLQVGDRLRIHYVYATAEEMRNARFSLWAFAQPKSDLRIRIERAEVRVEPVPAGVPQSGFLEAPRFAVDVRF